MMTAMRSDDLSQHLFDDQFEEAAAALARRALLRVDEDYPSWLSNVGTAPTAPAALIESVLAPSVHARSRPGRRSWWAWGGALAAAAALVLVFLPATSPPPSPSPQQTVALGRPGGDTLAMVQAVPDSRSLQAPAGRLVPMGSSAPMMNHPAALAMVKAIPSVKQALKAFALAPGDDTRAALLLALEEGGLRFRPGETITRVEIDPALAKRLDDRLPARLRGRLDGAGGLTVSE